MVDECLKKLQKGDIDAFDTLYRLTIGAVFSLCYSYLKNYHLAEDVAMDVYVAIKLNINNYNGKKGLNYILTIAKNKSLNALRSLKREVFTDGLERPEAFGVKFDVYKDEVGVIALAQEILNEKEFRIVSLKAIGGVSLKDVAKIINENAATVRWRYQNALSKLRKALEKNGYEK